MNIRPAAPHDAVAIQQMLAQLGYPPPDVSFVSDKIDAYARGDYHLLVAELGGEVVAFIALHWYHRFHSPGYVGRITAFCVSEHVRSQGIGTTMLSAAENFLKQKGCATVEVTSNNRRERAHTFYRSNGYIENSRKFVKNFTF